MHVVKYCKLVTKSQLFRSLVKLRFEKCKYIYPKLCYSPSSCKMSNSEESTWRGVPITQIYGAQSPWGAPEFPLVKPSSNHTVLYHIPSSGVLSDLPPKPQIGKDAWDQYHVRLPCSSQSLYPVKDESGEVHLKKRWRLIENALSKPIRNSQELIDAILSYNTRFKDKWKFRVLHKFFNKYLEKEETKYFFDVTLPEIVKLALNLPKLIQAPIPLLKQHKNHSISLSQQQISSLLANAFFCTFPRRNSTKKESEYDTYPAINFSRLYESSASKYVLEKLKCICYYFRRVSIKENLSQSIDFLPSFVATNIWKLNFLYKISFMIIDYVQCVCGFINNAVPTGVVTFSRRSVPPQKCPRWDTSTKPISALPVHTDSEVFIEHADGLIQVDFANRFLGGGVLGHGCVQEEIRFIICPELIASMVFSEEMRPNEAIMIIGVEQYSEYSGYGNDFEWAGPYQDGAPYDSSCRKRCAVLAIDAISYSRKVDMQYEHDKISRELNKAWVGFSFFTDEQPGLSYPGVATGNWGCGVYRGSPYLKSLVQMMACAAAGRPMAYYTFKDRQLRDDIANVYNLLSRQNVTVGQLYKYVLGYCDGNRSQSLHTYLTQVLEQDTVESAIDVEPMEVSACSEVLEVSPAEERTGDNRSPDLFSQDNFSDQNSQASKGVYFRNTESMKSNSVETENTAETLYKMADSGSKMAENKTMLDRGDKLTAFDKRTNESTEVSNTSRFFVEMEKLDESNGKLNFNTTNTSFLDLATSPNNTLTDNEQKIQVELSAETKKKLSGKITDYFSKKRT